MAYFSQERKKALAPEIKKVLKEYGIKGSISVRNHSTLVVNISSGTIDFDLGERGCVQVNHYAIERNYQGISQEFLMKLKNAMMLGNWNNSDLQSDYWDVGWYIDINIGNWDKPYQLIKQVELA